MQIPIGINEAIIQDGLVDDCCLTMSVAHDMIMGHAYDSHLYCTFFQHMHV
jgi:hypothetical protein